MIFALDWFKHDESTLLHYAEFLVNLNMGHGGGYLDKTFATLVDTFRARTAVVNGTCPSIILFFDADTVLTCSPVAP